MVLDKTGTLTYGQPEVRALVVAEGATRGMLLSTAASAELRSEHPLGKTIVAHARALAREFKEPERRLLNPCSRRSSTSPPSSRSF